MKKLLFTLFVFASFTAGFSQTILSSHPIKLRNSRNNHQLLNAVNSKNQVFAFISDKEKLTALKYNQALFFSDCLSVNRPDKEYELIAGFGFEDNGNPNLYWASEDFKKVQSINFDFENRTALTDNFQFDFKDEDIITTFSENNSFYILTLPKKEDKIKIYLLNKGEMNQKTLDFSTYKFTDEKGKAKTFNELVTENGLELIDAKVLNPLFQTVGKAKMYVEANKLVLTFDSSAQTQLLEIDLTTFAISQQLVPQPVLVKQIGKSNSYFHQNKLYQFKTNEEELAITAVDLKSGQLLKKYYADANDTISFRNSPLFSQTGGQRGKIMKNTKKFLQRLNLSDIGISVYKTHNDIMLTVGGVRSVNSTGGMLLGISAGVAMVATGTGGDMSGLFDDQNLQSTYFEALFDDKFEHQNVPQQGLAVDFISQFIAENGVSLQSVFPYKNYYILGYYDSKKKEYVMRKFEDISESN